MNIVVGVDGGKRNKGKSDQHYETMLVLGIPQARSSTAA